MTAARFAIRPADECDTDAVQQISAEAYIQAYQTVIGVAPRPASEDYRPRIERREVWVLQTAEGPIGVIVLETKTDCLLLYSIAVRPSHQGRGYGTALLAFADQHAIATGLPKVRLYTNKRMTQNICLYRKCGFSEIGTRPHPSRPGEFLVDMAKAPAQRSSVDP